MPDFAPLTKVFLVTLLLGLASSNLYAQDGAASADSDAFPPDQIEQMVAPIALYPDALIAQIMMASTYPLDVVQANRWVEEHEDIKDDALQQAVDQESWDDSVKALVFFPSVLGFMSENLDWTQDLGDAVLAQQGDVTDAIQRLRDEAEAAGTLTSSDQQRVEKSGDTIIIQPAQPEVVYVPTYDPVKVYGESGPPATAYYPDAYADAATSYSTMESAVGTYPTTVPAGTTAVYPTTEVDSSNDSLINFGLGAVAGGLLTAAIMWDDDDRYDRLYYGGPGYYGAPSYWGQPNYWNNNGWREPRNINVDRNITRNVERGDVTINKGIVGNELKRNEIRKWEHNPERRGGVRYRDASTDNRFAAKRKDVNINRDEARGRVRDGDRNLKAPDLGQVKREGAASGGLSKLADNRGDGAGKLGDLKERRPDSAGGTGLKDRQGGDRAANLKDRAAQRPAGGDARAKIQAKAPERKAAAAQVKAKPKPKAQAAAAKKRPVNREVKRPSAPAKRPAAAAAKPKARPASRPSAPKASAFKANKPKATRAASNRGGASRAKAQRGGGGGAKRGGGGRRRG